MRTILAIIVVALAAEGCSRSDPAIKQEEKSGLMRQLLSDPSPEASKAYDRGFALSEKKEYKAAIAEFSEAIRLAPNFEIAYNQRGLAWRELGDLDKAIADFDEAIRVYAQPSFAFHLNRGNAWRMKKEFEKAFADLDKAVEITAKQSPKMQARAYEARGLVYLEKQDTQKGLDDLDEAIRRDPKLASAYRNRADVFVGKKDYDKAIADLTEAIGLEPLSRSYSYRANLRLLKREYANAISDCKETIRLDPMDDITMVILARLLATVPNAEMRDGKYALELGLRANQLKNESFLCMEAVASAHAELGDFAEAIRWQEKAVARAGAIDVFGASFRLSMYKQKRPFRLD